MNELTGLVSVVIPYFNASIYIERCLKSIKNQTYKNVEVILVDDCSNDNTLEIISLFEKNNSFKLKVLKNSENIGPSLSRKKGVSVSSGDYICFCDSDDWYDDTFIEKMLSSLLNSEADIVFCGYKVVNSNNSIESRDLRFNLQPVTKQESLVVDCDSLCMMLVKKSIISGVEVPNIRNGEDAALIPILIQKSNKIHLISDCLYNYYRRSDSASEQIKSAIVDSLKESFLFIKENISNDYYDEIEYLGIRNFLYPSIITLLSISNNKKEGLKLLKEFQSFFPRWNKNKYVKNMRFYKRMVLGLLRIKAFFLIRLIALIRLKKTRASK